MGIAAAVIVVLVLVAFVWGRNRRNETASEEHASQSFFESATSPYDSARGKESRRQETMGTCV